VEIVAPFRMPSRTNFGIELADDLVTDRATRRLNNAAEHVSRRVQRRVRIVGATLVHDFEADWVPGALKAARRGHFFGPSAGHPAPGADCIEPELNLWGIAAHASECSDESHRRASAAAGALGSASAYKRRSATAKPCTIGLSQNVRSRSCQEPTSPEPKRVSAL